MSEYKYLKKSPLSKTDENTPYNTEEIRIERIGETKYSFIKIKDGVINYNLYCV